MQEKNRGVPPDAEVEGGAPPKKRVLPAHGLQERDGGDPDHEVEGGNPLISVRFLHTACRGGRGGGTPNQERETGTTTNQECTPFMRGLIQEMRGGPQDLHRPPTAR